MLADERDVFTHPPSGVEIEVTTLTSVANNLIRYDIDDLEPLSLDGAEGRKMEFELIESDVASCRILPAELNELSENLRSGLAAPAGTDRRFALCCDLIDEFSTVLESLGERNIDEIAAKYLSERPGPRSLGRTRADKLVIIDLYRKFRQTLEELRVVSLDQFIADFLDYLQSFRWEAVRSKKGFDIVFVDELHLFNRQERHVLRFLTRDVTVRRVAVAYDPRQSPRNTFFPSVRIIGRDTIWSEPRLAVGSKDFNFADIFRYTPQILSLLRNLDQNFPGSDLAAEWGLVFGVSKVAAGEKPNAREHKSARLQAKFVSERAINLSSRSKGRKRVAVLCLDPSQFDEYRQAGLFTVKFVIVSARDETALIQKYNERPILSMPEYVAGLQFDTVLLVDVNASLIVRLGGGINGLHKFISTTYLGASRAMRHLEIHANKDQGGLPAPIQQAVHEDLINAQS